MPDVANAVGIESTELIDGLYDDKTHFLNGAMDYLHRTKRFRRFIKKPPRDALTTIRLADIKSKEFKPNKFADEPIITSIERLKELDKMCEKLGIPKPSDDDVQKQPVGNVFISMVNQVQNPYLDFKSCDNIQRLLVKQKYLKMPKTE